MWEQYYTSVENNFEKTIAFIAKINLLEYFKPRLRQCVYWASPCGWGFADTIADIYYGYFVGEDWNDEDISVCAFDDNGLDIDGEGLLNYK